MNDIIIDATHFGSDGATGVENYVRYLLPLISERLLKLGWKVRWVGHDVKAPKNMPKKVQWLHSPHRPFWSQIDLLRLLNKEKPAWFFTPSGIAPLGYRGRTVMTVHDMSAYVSPEAFTKGQRFRLRTLMRRTARHASVIFTPSAYSKEQVTRFWNITADHIHVTPLSCDAKPVEPEEMRGINPNEPLMLYVSRIESKKNVIRIIEAFAKVQHPTVQLVLAGKDGLGAAEIKTHIASLPAELRRRIYLPGYISSGQREWLLCRAVIFLVPGALEGFSLPLLEAFAHGVPAICASAGPLPEIGADACLYANPNLTDEWTTAMESLLRDPILHQELEQAGRERVKRFTWEQTAKLSIEALVSAV